MITRKAKLIFIRVSLGMVILLSLYYSERNTSTIAYITSLLLGSCCYSSNFNDFLHFFDTYQESWCKSECGGVKFYSRCRLNCGLVFFSFTMQSVLVLSKQRKKFCWFVSFGTFALSAVEDSLQIAFPQRKQKSIWLFIDIRCCETKKADRKNICEKKFAVKLSEIL